MSAAEKMAVLRGTGESVTPLPLSVYAPALPLKLMAPRERLGMLLKELNVTPEKLRMSLLIGTLSCAQFKPLFQLDPDPPTHVRVAPRAVELITGPLTAATAPTAPTAAARRRAPRRP